MINTCHSALRDRVLISRSELRLDGQRNTVIRESWVHSLQSAYINAHLSYRIIIRIRHKRQNSDIEKFYRDVPRSRDRIGKSTECPRIIAVTSKTSINVTKGETSAYRVSLCREYCIILLSRTFFEKREVFQNRSIARYADLAYDLSRRLSRWETYVLKIKLEER